MADMQAALRTRLLADAPVAAVTTRIYWGDVPQGTALPYIRLNVASDPRPEHLKGYHSARVTRVQADCYAASQKVAWLLGEKVITALSSAGVTTAGVLFGRIKGEGPQDLSEEVPGIIGRVSNGLVELFVEHKQA